MLKPRLVELDQRRGGKRVGSGQRKASAAEHRVMRREVVRVVEKRAAHFRVRRGAPDLDLDPAVLAAAVDDQQSLLAGGLSAKPFFIGAESLELALATNS